jgi:integrase
MSAPHAIQTTPKATLETLIRLVADNPNLTESNRREIISAIHTVAKVLKSAPHLVPASQSELRPLINDALPIAVGVKDIRWRNAKSLLRKAMALLDPMVIPARSRAALSPEWATLLAEPSAAPLHRGLARFSKYCSVNGITPAAVTQTVYDGFYTDLVEHCILRSPRETQQTAGKAWNKARVTVPGWPHLELEIGSFRRNPSLPLSAFPESYQQDVEAYLAPRTEDEFDLFDETPTLRHATINGKRLQIRQLTTAIVETGRDPASFHSLADLIDIKTAKAGLEALTKRTAEQKTSRNHGVAYMLLNDALYWVKADETTIKTLKLFCKNLAPKKGGMTRKNKQRLQQFDDPRQLDLLLNLPARIMEEACAVPSPTVSEARAAQLAVAIEILLMAPLRIANVSELEIGRTLMLNGTRSGYILIDGREVKNDYDIEIPLPRVTLRMLDTYLKRFHPLLAPEGCLMLFPSRGGEHKRSTVLSNQIKRCLRQRCGLVMNAHLFRHLAGKIYLDAFPGAYGVIRVLLGHKSIGITIKTYCGTENAAAFRAYDAFLDGIRGSGRQPTPVAHFGRRAG